MELNLFQSILTGTLKPWLPSNQDTKFFNHNLSVALVKPSTQKAFYDELFKIFGKDHECLKTDGLEIYNQLPSSSFQLDYVNQIFNIPFPIAKSPQERFYAALISNETNFILQKLVKTLSKRLEDNDRKLILYHALSNIKSLLKVIGNQNEITSQFSDQVRNVIEMTKLSLVRLLIEIQAIFPQYLTELPIDKYQIFQEWLSEDVPVGFDNWINEKTLNEIKRAFTQVELNIPLKKEDIAPTFSFGFKGDTETLKTFCLLLDQKLEFFANPTTHEDLYQLFTQKSIDEQSPEIYLHVETQIFSYVLNEIKSKFSNLTPTTIEKSGKFHSKDNPSKSLTRQNIYASKPKYELEEKASIDSIISHLK